MSEHGPSPKILDLYIEPSPQTPKTLPNTPPKHDIIIFGLFKLNDPGLRAEGSRVPGIGSVIYISDSIATPPIP